MALPTWLQGLWLPLGDPLWFFTSEVLCSRESRAELRAWHGQLWRLGRAAATAAVADAHLVLILGT